MSAFQPGDLVGGRYRLSRIIGAGAMGTVWSARNESTDRDFALKLMLPDAVKNPVSLQRFFQEAKASGRLRHRCIVEVYDLGRIEQEQGKPPDPHEGTPYLVMELLEGEPLDSVLRRRKGLPIGTTLKLVRDLARGLDVAHKQRIVHRDLKPANIYLHKSLEGGIVPKILDFGVSKLVGPGFDPVATSAGTVLGSPAYMSPEQAAGEADVDGRSDVWSLGVILYKCLLGKVPFQAANYNALMIAITRSTHAPLEGRVEGVTREIDLLVDKCLAKDRDKRFDSAKDLADELDRWLESGIPVVSLDEIVLHEQRPVEDRAAGSGDPQGTLAATELKPAAVDETKIQISHEPLAQTTKSRSKRVQIVASAVGAVLVLAIVIFFARSPSRPIAAPPPNPVAPAAPAPTPSAQASASASAEPVAPAAPSVVASASVAPIAAPKQAGKPMVKVIPKTTAPKPAHEGVTGAGF